MTFCRAFYDRTDTVFSMNSGNRMGEKASQNIWDNLVWNSLMREN